MQDVIEKPKLLLLLEALRREPSAGERVLTIKVSEYTYDIARHAKECEAELDALFPAPKA